MLTKALEKDGLKPILIGGCALEYYTLGGYTTGDVDIALPTIAKVEDVFAELGFERERRYWVHKEYDLLFEAPTANLAGEEAELTEVVIGGLHCFIIGIEDLIIDRLKSYVHWKWEDDGRWVKRLIELHGKDLDIKYIREKARKEGTLAAFEKLLK